MILKLIMPAFYDAEGVLVRNNFMPSLALYGLANCVPADWSLKFCDENVDALDFADPVDAVGVSVNTINVIRAYEIADRYRESGVKVILGGIHASFLPDEAAPHADAVVIGEAEDTFPRALVDLAAGALKREYRAEKPVDIASVPTPRYDLIDFGKYMRLPFRRGPIIPIHVSRGCPRGCSFCAVTRYWGGKVRYRPTADIVRDIRASGSDTFFLIDDNLSQRPQKMEEICSALAPLRVKYVTQLDTTIVRHPRLISLAAQSGLILAYIGFESIQEDDQKDLRKEFNKPETFSRLLKLFRRRGISVYTSIIFGMEKDDREKMRRTVDFFIRRKSPLALFTPLTPYPGTLLYEELKARGRIVHDRWWLDAKFSLPTCPLIRYEGGLDVGGRLCRAAMRRFYSYSSIIRRFLPFGVWRAFLMFFMNVRLAVNYRKYKRFSF